MKQKYDVHVPVKHVVDLFSDERAQSEKLAVNAMQHRLEEVTLARILRVEQFEQLEHEILVNVSLGDARLKVGRLQEAQVELVDELQMRPRRLQRRFVLLGIEFSAVRIRRWRQRSEEVDRKLERKNEREHDITSKFRRVN